VGRHCDEFFRLLGCYPEINGLKSTFRGYLLVRHLRLKLSFLESLTLKTDVSGLFISPIFKGPRRTAWPLNIGAICSRETSVLNRLTPRNNPVRRKNSFQQRRELMVTHSVMESGTALRPTNAASDTEYETSSPQAQPLKGVRTFVRFRTYI
jgi:hypothetical protein